MKTLTTTAFILLLCFSHILGQGNVIKGKLLDASNQGLEFANVLLYNAQDSSLIKGGLSELDGLYQFVELADGSYFVEASMVGYTTVKTEIIAISENQIYTASNLTLAEGVDLQEVTVTAKRPLIEMKADKLVVNVANSLVAAGNSALEILRKSPGVNVDSDNVISLRGREGVLVTINGKNQYMSGDDIARMLESMPASNIQSIEIITNPSAKYDAEGNSGIINIVLKKNENLGINGNHNVTVRQGRRTSVFTDVGLNYRTKNLNIYGAADYYNFGNKRSLNLERQIPFEGGITTFDQLSEMNNGGDGYNARIGIDWNLGENTTVGVLAKINDGIEDNNNINNTFITGDNAPDFYQLLVETDHDQEYLQTTGNINLKHQLSDNGATLTFDTDYSTYERTDDFMYTNKYMDEVLRRTQEDYLLHNYNQTAIEIFASTLDLSLPINEQISLESGVKYSDVTSDNTTLFEDQTEDGSWVTLEDRSNSFIYNEQIMAAYVNSNINLGKVQIQAGLRVENTASLGNSTTLDQQVKRDYTNLFPSISLSHQIKEDHSLSYSFSRRLNRPNYRDLNPFEFYLDQYTFQKGNPFLNPQYTNAYSVNYGFKNAVYVSLGYNYTQDEITEILDQRSSENKTFLTNYNFDNFQNYSINVSSPIPWNDIITSRLNYTTFYNEFTTVFNGLPVENSSYSHIVAVANEVRINNNINMELNGNYQSSIAFGIFQLQPQFNVDFGFGMKIMDGQGQIKVGVNDIFRSQIGKVEARSGEIYLDAINDNDTRRVNVSFGYRFGNQKVKGSRRRKTATQDEANRI